MMIGLWLFCLVAGMLVGGALCALGILYHLLEQPEAFRPAQTLLKGETE